MYPIGLSGIPMFDSEFNRLRAMTLKVELCRCIPPDTDSIQQQLDALLRLMEIKLRVLYRTTSDQKSCGQIDETSENAFWSIGALKAQHSQLGAQGILSPAGAYSNP